MVRAVAEGRGLGVRAIDALTVFLERVLNVEEERRVGKWQQRAAARLVESLEALTLEQVRAAKDAADIGSGAGYPGLVLAAALPDTRVTLIEVKNRRCGFLREAIEAMAIENVTVVQRRVQAFATECGERFDLVTSRGVSKLEIMQSLGAPLLEPGGALVLWGRCKERHTAAEALGFGLEPAGVVRTEGVCLHAYTKLESPAGMAASGLPRLQRADRKSPRRPQSDVSASKCEARIKKLSREIADLDESRSRASPTQRAQLEFDIQRLAERRTALGALLEAHRSRSANPGEDT